MLRVKSVESVDCAAQSRAVERVAFVLFTAHFLWKKSHYSFFRGEPTMEPAILSHTPRRRDCSRGSRTNRSTSSHAALACVSLAQTNAALNMKNVAYTYNRCQISDKKAYFRIVIRRESITF